MDERKICPLIFIVEDDEDDKLILSQELKDSGLEKESHIFSSIHELLDSSDPSITPSVILLDAFSREIDIREAIDLIKSDEKLSAVPILVMIGGKTEKGYFRSYQLDVTGYIAKPVNVQVLKRFLKLS